MGAFDGIDSDQRRRIVAEVRKELRRTVEDEVRERLTRQITEQVRRDTRREVAREIEERAPTEAERQRFVDYVEDVELDALALASLASGVATRAEEELARAQRRSVPVAWALALAAPTIIWASARSLGGATSAFAAVLATLTLALVFLTATNLRRHGRLTSHAAEHRRIASDYLIVAERAKAYRMVHAERIAEAAELDVRLAELRKLKEARDEAFHARSDEVEAARLEARRRIEPAPRIVIEDEESVETEGEHPQERSLRRRR